MVDVEEAREEWDGWTVEERYELLAELVNEALNDLGYKSTIVDYGDADAVIGFDVDAYYDSESDTVVLDEDLLEKASFDRAASVALHESAHVMQYDSEYGHFDEQEAWDFSEWYGDVIGLNYGDDIVIEDPPLEPIPTGGPGVGDWGDYEDEIEEWFNEEDLNEGGGEDFSDWSDYEDKIGEGFSEEDWNEGGEEDFSDWSDYEDEIEEWSGDYSDWNEDDGEEFSDWGDYEDEMAEWYDEWFGGGTSP